MNIATLNNLSRREAAVDLGRCCGSGVWQDRMVAARPFKDVVQLLLKAEEIWWDLGAGDWQEAFAGHRVDAPESHAAYYEVFGYQYVAYIDQQSDNDLRENYQRRLANDPITELTAAASEQARITNRHLRQMLGLG